MHERAHRRQRVAYGEGGGTARDQILILPTLSARQV
jgi:hypothetical protein